MSAFIDSETQAATEVPDAKGMDENSSVPDAVTEPASTAATGAAATEPNDATTVVVSSGKSSGKQGKKTPRASPTLNMSESTAASAVAAANLAAAVQLAASLQLNGLLSVLTQSSTPGALSAADPTVLQTHTLPLAAANANWQIPTPEVVRQAALKAVQDAPPFCHLSKTDSAPQLKITDSDRLTLKGGMRGYRMARASHGVSRGHYYFELVVHDPPPIEEIVNALPPNARLGPSLQKQIQKALEYEKKITGKSTRNSPSTMPSTQKALSTTGDANDEDRKRKAAHLADEESNKQVKAGAYSNDSASQPQAGGHLRVGWSMRTGDLQAPVGYDKWSYGFRSINGSKIHQSRREDAWGAESWGPGDVVGCSISLQGSENPDVDENGGEKNTPAVNNEIRFFKNGVNLGHFVISKGKRVGGAAFEDVQAGTYYPAISSYLGGTVHVNFGPHFIYPLRKLPHGMNANRFLPMSSLQPPPLSSDEILSRLKKKIIFSKVHSRDTPDTKMAALREAVLAESQVLQDAHFSHQKKHLQFVLQARKERNLNASDIQEELDKLEGKDIAEESMQMEAS